MSSGIHIQGRDASEIKKMEDVSIIEKKCHKMDALVYSVQKGWKQQYIYIYIYILTDLQPLCNMASTFCNIFSPKCYNLYDTKVSSVKSNLFDSSKSNIVIITFEHWPYARRLDLYIRARLSPQKRIASFAAQPRWLMFGTKPYEIYLLFPNLRSKSYSE